MSNYISDWPNNTESARKWADGWVKNAEETGNIFPAQCINKCAKAFKKRFCTNGIWVPGAEAVFEMLQDKAWAAAQKADEY